MTRVLPLPAPARISTGPSVVSTASRCCGFSWSRKDNAEVAPESLIQFYKGMAARGIVCAHFWPPMSEMKLAHFLRGAALRILAARQNCDFVLPTESNGAAR